MTLGNLIQFRISWQKRQKPKFPPQPQAPLKKINTKYFLLTFQYKKIQKYVQVHKNHIFQGKSQKIGQSRPDPCMAKPKARLKAVAGP